MPTKRTFATATALLGFATAGLVQLAVEEAQAQRGDEPIEAAALDAIARRIDAFNGHDLDAFLGAHAEGVGIYDYPELLLGEGRAHLERLFGPLFERGLGSTRVHGQWVLGSIVVSNETVVEDGAPRHVVFVYTVSDGEIASMRLIASPQEDARGGAARVSPAEDAALAAVVRSIDGFNAHDVDAYLASHAEDVGIYVYPERLLASERAHLGRVFGPQLERGDGAIIVRGQWVQGNVVLTDYELTSNGVAEPVIAIHSVENGVIRSLRLIEEE